MYFTADLLYWQAKVEGLSPFVECHAPFLTNAKPSQFNFEWDPGFRLGLGQVLERDRWDISLIFTHLHSKAYTSATSSDSYFIFPSWSAKKNPDHATLESASARWRLHLGLLDAELGRNLFPGKSLMVKPHIGLRSSWVRQKIKMIYEGGTLFPGETDTISSKNKFWGIGPRMGVNTEWEFVQGWSVFADADFSLITGNYYIHEDESTPQTDFLGIHSTYPGLSNILELGLGLRRDMLFEKSGVYLKLDLGWEEMIFFSENNLMQPISSSKTAAFASNLGDLVVQGVSLRATVDF